MSYSKLKTDYGLCDTLPYANSSGSTVTGGSAVVIGEKLGIVYDDTPDGESGVAIVGAPAPGILIPKATGITFGVGDPVTWDVADENANDDTVNNTIVGHAYAAAASGDTEVQVVLTNEHGVA